jgi:hypothetical protein
VFSRRGLGWMEESLGGMCDFSQGMLMPVEN